MDLSPTRYVKIDGSEVIVAIASAHEARAAIKELKHKKKEFAWLKKTLAKEIKSLEARTKRAVPKGRRPRTWLDKVRTVVNELAAGPQMVRASVTAGDLPAMRRESKRIDDILHNLDSALLQVEGKLLHFS